MDRTARQDSRGRTTGTGQLDRIAKTEQRRQDSQNMTTRTVRLGKEHVDRLVMAGQPIQRKERTGQPEHDRKDSRAGNRTAGTGQLKQNRQDRTASAGQ